MKDKLLCTKFLLLALFFVLIMTACQTEPKLANDDVALDEVKTMFTEIDALANSINFPPSGKLKILVFADTQDIQFVSSKLIKNMENVLDTQKPDLVLFTGDQLEGHSFFYLLGNKEKNVKTAIQKILAPVVDRNIPFAIVFGNHDDQGGVSRELQMEYYKTFPNSLCQDEGELLPWCGTYNIPVISTDGKIALNLFMMDSGNYWPEGYYGCVTKEQIEWCGAIAEELKASNDNVAVPSMVFQHIIVPEANNLMQEVPKETKGAFSGKGICTGKFYLPTEDSFIDGVIKESLCCSKRNYGQFDSWKNQNVIAAFFGHDHINTFHGVLDDIHLVMCPGCTYVSYNNNATRGVRIIEIDQNNVEGFTTYTVPFAK